VPIFDQGYQHWDGQLSGHGTRWLAVARHGVRAQLKNRNTRVLMAVAWIPAIALVAFLTLWGLLEQQSESVVGVLARILPPEVVADPKSFRTAVWTIAYAYFFKVELFCTLFLVMIVGPNLVSRDLRFNAFPLYFSRPLRRIDYFVGKLAVIGFFLLATTAVPAVGGYAMGLAFSRDLSVVRDTHRLLWGGIFYSLVVTASAGTLMLALSSLSRRSIYVGLGWAGLVFLTHTVSSGLIGVHADTERRQMRDEVMNQWMKDNPPPKGVEMTRGGYPVWRNSPPPGFDQTPEDKARSDWMQAWAKANNEVYARAEEIRHAGAKTDWRPVVSYAYNLDRMADWFLGTDAAWVTFGRAVDRPRQMAGGPMGSRRGMPATGNGGNERILADRMVWQFPWYWSAGALAGVWVLSVFTLSRRVKSLDRLK
jgi:ABC-type transport system involved in multi-copper enzyme maturation permease subunit